MSRYIENLLGSGEEIVFETRLHPIICLFPLVVITIGVVTLAVLVSDQLVSDQDKPSNGSVLLILLIPVGLIWLVVAWIRRATTEIAVTTRRMVYKRGWISRNTIEINFKHIESLDIRQPILGRILGYGTVVVRGTGFGVQSMHDVAKPLQLRNAAFDQGDHL